MDTLAIMMSIMDSERPPSPRGSVLAKDGPLSADQVEAFLVGRFGRDVEEVVRLGQGEWSTAYSFRRAGTDYVVRFGAHREDFAKDRLAARYASPDLPIPAVTEIGRAFGGFYAVSLRAAGGYLDDLDQGRMRELLPSLVAMLDAARDVDLSGTSGYGAWGADGGAPHASWKAALLDVAEDRDSDRTHGWRERLAASPVGVGPFEEAFGHLRDLVDACPEERHLIHSDLLNYNVLVGNGRITAVIDWGCAMYGDFLYDLAWFLYWQPWYPAWRDIDFRGEAERHFDAISLDVPHLDERLRCYQVHIGLAGLAYRAFKGDWAEVGVRARRTLALARPRR